MGGISHSLSLVIAKVLTHEWLGFMERAAEAD
jgi:hypothetical protein